MSDKKPISLNCPTCQQAITWDESFPYRPFCSERCQLIDLGDWANESHRIPGEDASAQNDEL